MRLPNLIAIAACALLTAACAGKGRPFDVGAGVPASTVAQWGPATVNVAISEDLEVFEKINTINPPSDKLVWHGDGPGTAEEKKAQVRALMTEAIADAAGEVLGGGRPVAIDVMVITFNALTPRSRQRYGGLHNVDFDIAVRDAATGEVLAFENGLEADADASGGTEAIELEARGVTEKDEVQNRVREVVRAWLTSSRIR